MPRPRYEQPHSIKLDDPDLDEGNPALIQDRILSEHLRQKRDAMRGYKDDRRKAEETSP